MPKELFNQTLKTTLSADDRFAVGIPSQTGCDNIKYSALITELQGDVLTICAQSDIVNEATTENAKLVTPLRYWQGLQQDNIQFGAGATADGTYSIAIGKNADGNSTQGIAIGYGASAGSDAVAIGVNASADDPKSVAIGYGARSGTAAGQDGVSIGKEAGGDQSDTAAYNTFVGALAGKAITGGDYNTVIGGYSYPDNDVSQCIYVGFGAGIDETANSQFVVGQATDTLNPVKIIRGDFVSTFISIGSHVAKSKLDVNGGVKIADDSDAASADKVGTMRYRTSGNNSYFEICMQDGASSYVWAEVLKKSW